MTIVFSVALLVLKQMMKTQYGADGNGDESTFGSGSSDFSSGSGSGRDDLGDEPTLDNFKASDLMGYEASDETGQMYPTDDLINQLYDAEGTFSEDKVLFLSQNQTFSGDEL